MMIIYDDDNDNVIMMHIINTPQNVECSAVYIRVANAKYASALPLVEKSIPFYSIYQDYIGGFLTCAK